MVDPERAFEVRRSIQRHTCYFSEELVIFALFDDKIEESEQQVIAKKHRTTKMPKEFEVKYPLLPFPNHQKRIEDLMQFVVPRSWVIF